MLTIWKTLSVHRYVFRNYRASQSLLKTPETLLWLSWTTSTLFKVQISFTLFPLFILLLAPKNSVLIWRVRHQDTEDSFSFCQRIWDLDIPLFPTHVVQGLASSLYHLLYHCLRSHYWFCFSPNLYGKLLQMLWIIYYKFSNRDKPYMLQKP